MQIKNYYYNGCKRCLLMEKGKLNRITDVEGVLVGHKTISSGTYQTGVTFIRTAEDVFHQKLACGCSILNGLAKQLAYHKLWS